MNPDCPIFVELLSIVKKTFGVSSVISLALMLLGERVNWVFVFGSVASGKEMSTSDIDLMIIGDVGFTEVVTAVYSIQETLVREINPKIYSKKEWMRWEMAMGLDNLVGVSLEKVEPEVVGGLDFPPHPNPSPLSGEGLRNWWDG